MHHLVFVSLFGGGHFAHLQCFIIKHLMDASWPSECTAPQICLASIRLKKNDYLFKYIKKFKCVISFQYNFNINLLQCGCTRMHSSASSEG